MMAEPKSEVDLFQDQMERLYLLCTSTDALQKIREKALDHFLELGLPTRKSEVFRYVRLRNLYNRTFTLPKVTSIFDHALDPYIYPECKNSVLVFLNGYFQSHLSRMDALPKRLTATSLLEASHTFGAFLNNQWAKSLKDETDPFAVLNSALHSQGCFVYIPPKTISKVPLQILNVVDSGDEPMLLNPRIHFFVGAQSEIDLYPTQAIINGKNYCMNMVAELTLEEEAHVRYTQSTLNVPQEVWHFDALRAYLKRNSTLKTISITNGSQAVRNDYRIALTGENAEALLNGVWMLSGKREAHTHVTMDHQAPYCRSMQLFKGILNDTSQSSFEGKILVRQQAQKTEAYQLNHNLLLSDKAIAQSKPNLEIFADDVKASHGATVGQLDKEQLFYMLTRGIPEVAAKSLLIYGFSKEIIDLIHLPSLSKEAAQLSQNYVKGG